ncbi:glycoside hydrolase family 5 protein [Lysobacter gummosus]|uniref:Glycoside hydrolase family 5 protein n=1 Tax=Lysobacter gummosus TaxID=262324 RepID=A0ABY3XHZ9_9GAMM|nr:glycoside hydrolase family 5 protein [Lysobacter gummosus]ALN90813.1 endoglucanase A [Lysobacter gummosus]UNP31273.1 glycoside hydrolase family 5 protein [Lysobacter gummosus]
MSNRIPFAATWQKSLALLACSIQTRLIKQLSVCGAAALLLAGPAFAQLPTAQQVAAPIRIGWNVGNTMEAICGETAWGNPAITQQLITSVKAAGFNAIRIPAAWDCHANQQTQTIDPTWMARVKQVVDYAYSQNMYVVLNIHWDGGWLEEHPLYSHQTANNQKQRNYWTQIANTFRNYNERMLFAGTNEVHADYGTPTSEHNTVQQSYNQTFVNAVRATGGNNASRTLIVQTYNTNMQHGINFFKMPTDSIANRLMVEVHFYDPYAYTLDPNGSCLYWGSPYPPQSACSWAQESYVDGLFSQVRSKWVNNGIPVIIGEYGVSLRSGMNRQSREYYLEYINRAARLNGIKTFYWDNGVADFALFNRSNGSVVDSGAIGAIKRGANLSKIITGDAYQVMSRHSSNALGESGGK